MKGNKDRGRTDWEALKLEFVNGSITMRELSDKHGVNASTLMSRAQKDGWTEARDKNRAETSKLAEEKLIIDRAEQLARFNEDDLKMARAIRAKAAQMMAGTNSPSDLRALASAADTAQKIGRLALGAETEHTLSSNRELPPITDDEFLG